MNDYRPKKKRLVRPGLQLRLIGVFSTLVAMAALFQAVLLAAGLEHMLPETARHGLDQVRLFGLTLAVTLAIWLPVVAAVGIAVTHRIAGPVHRFEDHLGALARGENPGLCRLREKDELQELGQAINTAVERLRLEAQPEHQRAVREAALGATAEAGQAPAREAA